MKEYDLVIVGAGPAGASAALFAQGDRLQFRLVESDVPCWFPEQAINTNFTNLENYLGCYNLSGTEITQRCRQHLESMGIAVHKEKVAAITKDFQGLYFETDIENYRAETAILATGTQPKRLCVNGVERTGRNIHYSFGVESSAYIGKPVLVVGGRNAGAVTAVRLKELGCHPQIAEKNHCPQAKLKYMERIRSLHIPYLTSTTLEDVLGDDNIETVNLSSKGTSICMHPAAIYVCIGYEPNNALAKQLGIALDNDGYIHVDRDMRTTDPRIFAAGDVNGGVKMMVVAAGEGAVAEYYANKYLENHGKNRVAV